MSHADALSRGEPARLSFALVTPSYYVDYERCRWLCETVDRHMPERVVHYLLVDYSDRSLFASLASARRRILFKEEILSGRMRQLPFARGWWIGPGGRPVRGWIVQQLAKLFMHEASGEDVFLFVDSGAFFVRPYDPSGTVRHGLVPLFRETGDFFRNRVTRTWHEVGARMFGIRPVRDYPVGYVKTLVTWRRDNLRRMHEHIERVTGASSLRALSRTASLSEYYLYGMYCDLILGDRALHYWTDEIETLSHWGTDKLGPGELRRFRSSLAPEHVLVMVNEKSGTALADIRSAFSEP